MFLSLLKAHWRKLVIPLLLVLAFLGGRLAAPTRVETREVEVERVVEVVRTVQSAAEIRYVDRVQRVVVTRETRPDGSSSEHSETTTGERETAASSSTSSTEAQREAVREVTREKLVEVHPDWRVSAMVGVEAWQLWAGTPKLQVGAAVERRVELKLGPMKVSGSAGGFVLAGVDGKRVVVGGKGTLEF